MTQTMRASVIIKPYTLETQELAAPNVGPGEVRVRVVAAGVCGTDLHLYGGHFDPVFPLVPGHEIAGIVDQVGAGVLDVLEGDRVALDPVITCGTCHHCQRGMRHHCTRHQALGVTRGRLLMHLLTESVLLAVLGGLAGLLVGLIGFLPLMPIALIGIGLWILLRPSRRKPVVG